MIQFQYQMFQRSKLVCKAVYELGIWASDSEGSVKQWTAKLVIAVSQCCRWWWKTNVKNSDELKCVWYGTYYRFNFLIGYWNSDRQCDVIWTAAKTTKNGRPRSVDRDNNSITSLFATLLNKHDTVSSGESCFLYTGCLYSSKMQSPLIFSGSVMVIRYYLSSFN